MKTYADKGSKARGMAKVPGPSAPDRCRLCKWCGPSGECLEDVIKSGRCGDWVWYVRGNKQCRRRWARPMDPKTPAQVRCRKRLGTASREYNEALTDAQQDACSAAGAKEQCRPRLGDSGTLTGQQHWVRQRCKGKTEVPARQARTAKGQTVCSTLTNKKESKSNSMKSNIMNAVALALVPAAMMVLTSCSSTPEAPEGKRTTVVTAEKGVPGGTVVDTYQVTATVTAIDAPNRKVTLVTPDGKKETVKVGVQAINFDQIRIGDQVKATVTQELAVAMAKGNLPANDGQAVLVALAPKGAKPGGVVAGTAQVTAKVKAIDLKNHKATLEFPDGTTKTVAVRPDVDLTQRSVGEEVVIRVTESVAIQVEKP
jgi:hypothetical protein